MKSVSDQPAADSVRPGLEKMQPPPLQPSGHAGAARDPPGGLDDVLKQSPPGGAVNPAKAEQVQMVQMFQAQGIDGFTVAKDGRGNVNRDSGAINSGNLSAV